MSEPIREDQSQSPVSVPKVLATEPRVKGERKKAKAAATAWKRRNAEYLGRRSETIEFPEQALAIWRGVGEEVAWEQRDGKLRATGKPKGLTARAPMVGDSIERQVYDRVESDRLLLGPGETLRTRIQAWPLPCTFYDPVPPLCPADVDAIRKQENAEALERTKAEAAKAGKGREARLLPGLSREGV